MIIACGGAFASLYQMPNNACRITNAPSGQQSSDIQQTLDQFPQLIEIVNEPLAFAEMSNRLQPSTKPQQNPLKSHGDPYRALPGHNSLS